MIKKLVLFALCMALIFGTVAGCGGSPDGSTDGTENTQQTESRQQTDELQETEDDEEFLIPLDIPIYDEKALFSLPVDSFALGEDASKNYSDSDSKVHYQSEVFRYFPTTAIRETSADRSYAAYESETGYRLYLFFDHVYAPDKDIFLTGFPIAIKDVLSYSDFAGLKAGDSIDQVEQVDSVVTLYKEAYGRINSVRTILKAQAGDPVCTLHYLREGLLKINYTMREEGKLVISEMILHKDYCVVDSLGRTVCHKIKKADLPGEINNDPGNSPSGTTGGTEDVQQPVSQPSDALQGTENDEDFLVALDIPIYDERSLLAKVFNAVDLGGDASETYFFSGNRPHYQSYIFEKLPTTAIREISSEERSYAVCESDTGYRFYLFFDLAFVPFTGEAWLTGFPIVIKDVLSYSDFAGLKAGDSIDKVEQVDSVVSFYKKSYKNANVTFVENAVKSGNPVCTFHYLEDGLLRINYTMPEEGKLVISKMILFEDYCMVDSLNRTVSHKIKNIDLPNS